MKKLILLCCILQCIFLTACWHHDKNISFQYKENGDSYSMDAWFSRSNHRAERYMTEKIGRENHLSFINVQSDAVFTLEDGSKFYLKKSPGHIMIKMNRDETSGNTYKIIKEMCRGMKDAVIQKKK